MREPPEHVDAAQVLDAARTAWRADLDHLEYLPVGFGAQHWKASSAERAVLFVTLDSLGARHDLDSLRGAYEAAAALSAAGLAFVHAGIAPYCIEFAGAALSATPWLDARTPTRLDIEETARLLARLHAAAPPAGVPGWRPLVPVDFADTLSGRVAARWTRGPHGERAREALRERLGDLARWTARYHQLAEDARQRPWVLTHGEPHADNQLVTAGATVLIDWESLKLAPPERDLRTIVAAGGIDAVRPDLAMLELFDLEWRLDEISQYADWFESPHRDNAGDRIAIEGLGEELDRPDWGSPYA